MKICKSCEIEKPLSDYSVDKSYKSGVYPVCKPCKNERAKLRYSQNDQYRSAVKAHGKLRFQAGSDLINEAKSQGCCKCPEKESVCLAFHHIDPNGKDFAVANARKFSLDRIRAEIAKCVIVCHNCHSKIHAGIIEV